MTGAFDWFAMWAGVLLVLSALYLHPRHSIRYPMACYIAAGTFASSMTITAWLREATAPDFHLFWANLELGLAVLFFALGGFRKWRFLHLAAAISFAGWGWDHLAALEASTPGHHIFLAPRWFHEHGAHAYLVVNFTLVLSLTVFPWLRRQRIPRLGVARALSSPAGSLPSAP